MIIDNSQARIIIAAIEFAYEGKEDAQLSNEGIIFLAETQAYLVSKLLPVNKNDIKDIIKDRMIKHIK
tara:strand:+ start:280 stop:483 length:204 start_codon:yes stop_codon:yes gene_type:complete